MYYNTKKLKADGIKYYYPVASGPDMGDVKSSHVYYLPGAQEKFDES